MTNAVQKIAEILKARQIEEPKLEARMMVASVLNLEANDLFFDCPKLNAEQEKQLAELAEKRLNHYPLCKLLGKKGFYKYDFIVSEDVLSPRPDTEILVEAAINYAKENKAKKILDLGTGSGCIILSVLGDVEGLTGVALDVSVNALDIAEKNADNLGLRNRIKFVCGSWFDKGISSSLGTDFDLIVTNPPYIPSKDIENLAEEVKSHDPMQALDGGEDGLRDYRQIAKISYPMLKDGGKIFIEGGVGQEKQIADIFVKEGFGLNTILKDYGGINRCIILKK